MQVLFVEAKAENFEKINPSFLKNLPKKIGLLSTVQYEDFAEQTKNDLEEAGKKVFLCKNITGCIFGNAYEYKAKVDAFLLLGSRFHALQLAKATKKDVFFSEGAITEKISLKEIEKIKAKRKAMLVKFFAAEKIGIIASIKPGQQNLHEAMKIKKALEKKNKEAFIFISDEIRMEEKENFPCESWINTACPSLEMLHASEIKEVL